MGFPKLGSVKKAQAPTDPIRIFETLPSLSGTFNDLWRGQARRSPSGMLHATGKTCWFRSIPLVARSAWHEEGCSDCLESGRLAGLAGLEHDVEASVSRQS
jgi:hypothetical protein